MAAPIEVTVKVKGLEELWSKVLAVSERFAKKGLRKALYAGSEVMRHEIQERAPRDTGRLSAYIGAKTTMSGKLDAGFTQVGPTRNAWYAGFLEFGTRKMAARPFIRPAFESTKETALNAYVDKMRQVFDEEVK